MIKCAVAIHLGALAAWNLKHKFLLDLREYPQNIKGTSRMLHQNELACQHVTHRNRLQL